MTHLILSFAKSDSGAVTVDWVVLTAALVGLGLAVMAVVSGGVEDLSGELQAHLVETDPNMDPFAGVAVLGDADAISAE
jgi:hypothetical protein